MEDRIKILKILKDDFPKYARECLFIKTKNAERVNFEFNSSQKFLHKRIEEHKKKRGKVRIVVLKARQFGISTYVEGRFTHKVMMNQNMNAFIMADSRNSSANIFDMTKRYYDNIPIWLLKPELKKSNEKALVFDGIDSSVRIGTAGAKTTGRSMTNQLLHCCLSKDSLVVMADGSTKTMDNINIGDRILTSSGAVVDVSFKTYTGRKQTYTLTCWCSGEPIHITSEHKVKTIDGFKKLSDISEDDYIAQPKIKIDNSIKTYEYRITNIGRRQNGGSLHKEYHKFILDKNFGYLLGYYLAEGHIKKGLGEVCFTYHKDEKYIHKALKSIKDICNKPKYKTEGNRGRTYIYDKFISSMLNDIVGRVENKHIPEWFFNTNKEFLIGVLNGYFDGDGSKCQQDRIVATSIREKISRQIRRIVLGLGLGACSIKAKKDVYRYNKKVNDNYTVGIFGDTLSRYNGVFKNENRTTKYKIVDGIVYCKVKSIVPRKIEEVIDIEVDHKDHDFQTTTGIVSNSEVGFWANTDDIITGLFQTVPNTSNSEIILESTANGIGGFFYDKVMEGLDPKSEWETVFLPWFWHDEYRTPMPEDYYMTSEEQELKEIYNLTDSQIYWRRLKIDGDFKGREYLFAQEYPASINEAFISTQNGLIQGKYIEKAKKCNEIDEWSPVVMGVDPARNGDRTVICIRKGREIMKVIKYDDMDSMRLVGIVKNLISKYNVIKCFIDVGCGYGTIDKLKEDGYSDVVRGIPFNSGADDKRLYANKRSEIFGEMRDWFIQDGFINIPDDETISKELGIIPDMKENSNGQWFMLPKDEIKKQNNGMSTDIADAIALTFSGKVGNVIKKKMKRTVGRRFKNY